MSLAAYSSSSDWATPIMMHKSKHWIIILPLILIYCDAALLLETHSCISINSPARKVWMIINNRKHELINQPRESSHILCFIGHWPEYISVVTLVKFLGKKVNSLFSIVTLTTTVNCPDQPEYEKNLHWNFFCPNKSSQTYGNPFPTHEKKIMLW